MVSNLRDKLHTATTENERTKVRRQLWDERRRIQNEKARQRMTHVLSNLSQGGWGTRALAARMTGMTTLKNDDGTTTTTTRDIVRAATTYYSDVFAPTTTIDDDNDCGYGCTVNELIDTSYDLWEHDIAITANMIFDATRTCPRNKTTEERQNPHRDVGGRDDDAPSSCSGFRMDDEQGPHNYTTTMTTSATTTRLTRTGGGDEEMGNAARHSSAHVDNEEAGRRPLPMDSDGRDTNYTTAQHALTTTTTAGTKDHAEAARNARTTATAHDDDTRSGYATCATTAQRVQAAQRRTRPTTTDASATDRPTAARDEDGRTASATTHSYTHTHTYGPRSYEGPSFPRGRPLPYRRKIMHVGQPASARRPTLLVEPHRVQAQMLNAPRLSK